MNVYIYQAELLCDDCGPATRRHIIAKGERPHEPDMESTYDSDDYPKGPYPDGGGESDLPQHCGDCGCFLENPLTDDGYERTIDAIVDVICGRPCAYAIPEWLKEWIGFYDISLADVLEHVEDEKIQRRIE